MTTTNTAGRQASDGLRRAIEADARRNSVTITIGVSTVQVWATQTFTGARHEIAMQAPESPELDAWLTELPEAELPIRGHLVADIIVTGVSRADGKATAKLEALTVEE